MDLPVPLEDVAKISGGVGFMFWPARILKSDLRRAEAEAEQAEVNRKVWKKCDEINDTGSSQLTAIVICCH